MKKYGNILIENVPNESTQFLKTLCTNYRPSNKPLVDQVKPIILIKSVFIEK